MYRSAQICLKVDTQKIPGNHVYLPMGKYRSASRVEIAKYHDPSRWLKATEKQKENEIERNLGNLISPHMTGIVISRGISRRLATFRGDVENFFLHIRTYTYVRMYIYLFSSEAVGRVRLLLYENGKIKYDTLYEVESAKQICIWYISNLYREMAVQKFYYLYHCLLALENDTTKL